MLIFSLVTVSVFEVDPSLQAENLGAPVSPFCYLPVPAAVSEEEFKHLVSIVETLELPSPEKGAILRSRFDSKANLGQFEYIFDLGNWNSNFHPEPSTDKKYASVLQILQYPFSRGSIHIRHSSNSNSDDGYQSTVENKPVIDPGYYSGAKGKVDLDTMTQCIRFSEKLCKSMPLSSVVRSRVAPPSSVTSNAGLRDWVVKNTTTDWHPIGTCAMGGHGGIHSSVVNDRLRVYGVKRLRVVDASIMPLQISAHLQATVYAIAEKAAHMIREDSVEKRA